MIKTYRLKKSTIKAIRLTADNFDEVVSFCKGDIKGIKLPIEDRVIDFWDGRTEQRVSIGDWVIREALGFYATIGDERFNELYEEVK